MRRINHAIFRTAIARLRDACLRPGTNAMLKRRQNGSAENRPVRRARLMLPAGHVARANHGAQAPRAEIVFSQGGAEKLLAAQF